MTQGADAKVYDIVHALKGKTGPFAYSRIVASMERRVKLPLLLGALPILAASFAYAWVPDPGAQATLASGKPFSEVLASTEGAGQIQAAIDIAAPPKTVWTVMNDCKGISRIVASMTICRVLSADPRHGWDIREQVTKGNLFIPTIHNVIRNDYQPYTLIRFRKAGGDLKVEEGEWRLQPLDGGAGTRVIYVNRVAANIAAPGPLVREGMKRDTAKVLVNLRRVCLEVTKSGA